MWASPAGQLPADPAAASSVSSTSQRLVTSAYSTRPRAALLARSHPAARVLIVGGEPAQVEAARAESERLGAGTIAVFTGQQPAREIPAFVQTCDVLVSPRIRGTNTPLKIYSYLRSGKPIVATDLLTHTQVLSR